MRCLAVLLIACACGARPHTTSTLQQATPSAAAADDGKALMGRDDATAVAHDTPIIHARVLAHRSAFQACYERSLRAKPGLAGEVTIRVTIDGDGTVSSAVGTGLDPAVATCCASVMYHVQFPPTVTGGPMVVNYPFQFRAETVAGSAAAPAAGSAAAPAAGSAAAAAVAPAHRAGIVGSTPTIAAGSAFAGTDADKEMIRTQVRRHLAQLRYCYEKVLLARPGLEGKVLVEFVIAPDGHVTSSSGSGLDPAVASCIAGAIAHTAFPAPGHVIHVNYPFVFRADKGAGSGQ